MIIQVSGIRDAGNIYEVERAGADWLAFDFVKESPRYVHQVMSRAGFMPDYSSLKNDSSATGGSSCEQKCSRTGIFANDMVQNIVTRIVNYHLDTVQLDGEETLVMIENLKRTVVPDLCNNIKVMKTIHVSVPTDLLRWKDYGTGVDFFRFDFRRTTGDNGLYLPAEWGMVEAYEGDIPFLISGEIGMDDIKDIRAVAHPKWIGVDVNERFETAVAMKDAVSLQAFVTEMRRER